LGCGFLSGGVSNQDIQSTVAAGINKTLAARPAPTEPPAPTYLPEPTDSPVPAPTPRARATSAPTVSTCYLPSLTTKSSGYISKVTLAGGVEGVNKDPVNPTTAFSPSSTIHAVVTTKSAPNNTVFKIVWYANDTNSAAPCNSFVGVYQIPTSGTRNIDFNMAPTSNWPAGTYRAEIYVNNMLDTVANFSIN